MAGHSASKDARERTYARQSTSCFLARKTWMPATSAGMTEPAERPCSCRTLDGLEATHVALQRVGHRDRAALLLIGLQHSDQRAADRNARAVQRMDVAH